MHIENRKIEGPSNLCIFYYRIEQTEIDSDGIQNKNAEGRDTRNKRLLN